MLKNAMVLIVLISTSICICFASPSKETPSYSFIVNNFNVDDVAGLPHPVCMLSLADNNNDYLYNYVEGGICPGGERVCTYSAIIKLNGELIILKQVSSKRNISIFKNNDMTVVTTKNPLKQLIVDEEGEDINAVIEIKTKNGNKKLNMTGYCGI